MPVRAEEDRRLAMQGIALTTAGVDGVLVLHNADTLVSRHGQGQ
jgi:L-asparaginase/Glu-tRNA(Gln) amidotransferase subunit D